MIKNKNNSTKKGAYYPLKGLVYLTFACSILMVSGCGKIQMPRFSSEKEKITAETEEKRNELREEISYLDEKQPKQRLNPKNLFGKTIRNESERMDRLERAVQDMRNEFNSVKPSINRLMSLEGDIQRLIHELKTISQGGEPAMESKPMTLAKSQTKKKSTYRQKPAAKTSYQKKSPPPASGGATVYDVRTGEHPGKTRLVIDVNKKTGFNVDIDNDEKIMVIELPQANWTAAMSRNFPRSRYVSSYSVEQSGNGHIMILQLKRSARISYQDDLPGSGSSRRLVIDVSDL